MSLAEIERRFAALATGAAEPGPGDPPRERVALYRSLIAGSFGGLLEFACPRSLARLARAGAPPLPELVLELLRAGGPRTHSTRELLDRFAAHLRLRRPELFAADPDLERELVRERLELEARYAEDRGWRPLGRADFEAWGRLDPDRIPGQVIGTAPWAERLPSRLARGSGGEWCTREADGEPAWRRLAPAADRFLARLAEEGPSALGRAAEFWEDGPPAPGPERLAAFLALLGRLAREGLLARPAFD